MGRIEHSGNRPSLGSRQILLGQKLISHLKDNPKAQIPLEALTGAVSTPEHPISALHLKELLRQYYPGAVHFIGDYGQLDPAWAVEDIEDTLNILRERALMRGSRRPQETGGVRRGHRPSRTRGR